MGISVYSPLSAIEPYARSVTNGKVVVVRNWRMDKYSLTERYQENRL